MCATFMEKKISYFIAFFWRRKDFFEGGDFFCVLCTWLCVNNPVMDKEHGDRYVVQDFEKKRKKLFWEVDDVLVFDVCMHKYNIGSTLRGGAGI